jgi:endonuclease-3 related protein
MPRVTLSSEAYRQTLWRYYRRLYRHFGPQHWWPARSRAEVVLGALLTQNTAWTNVQKAINNLRRNRALSLRKLRLLPVERLANLLRPTGYFRQKSRYVRSFLRHLEKHHHGSLPRFLRLPTRKLRAELLDVPGIGPETADSILLYAAQRPVFVVDAYTRRVLSRHGLASDHLPYHHLQAFFHRHLPSDVGLYNEYHALLVAVGKTYCHRRQPDCSACPLGVELESTHGRQ